MPLTKYWVKDALGEDKNKGVVEEWSRYEPTWFLGKLLLQFWVLGFGFVLSIKYSLVVDWFRILTSEKR